MKIYTKTGDNGTSSLIGGKRVSKCDPRLEAYGTLDELSSFIGLAKNSDISEETRKELQEIQEILISINVVLASPDEDTVRKYAFDDKKIAWIEGLIDNYSLSLQTITTFLVPGTNRTNALLNVCRTVCRRAEREIHKIELFESQKSTTIFINRLSDYFFVIGRKYE